MKIVFAALTGLWLAPFLSCRAESLVTSSKFSDELNPGNYRELEGLDAPRAFSWDFSDPAEVFYRWSQRSSGRYQKLGNWTPAEKAESPGTSEGLVESDLTIRAKANGFADLDFEAVVRRETTGGDPAEARGKGRPSFVLADIVPERVSFEKPLDPSKHSSYFFFPLPEKAIAPGESFELESSREIEGGEPEETLETEAKLTVQLNRYVRFNGKRCAELESQLMIHVKAKDPDSDLFIRRQMRSRYYFDVDRRQLVKGIMVDVVRSQFDDPGPGPDSPKVTMLKDSDELVIVSEREPSPE